MKCCCFPYCFFVLYKKKYIKQRANVHGNPTDARNTYPLRGAAWKGSPRDMSRARTR